MNDIEIMEILKSKVRGTKFPYVHIEDRNALARVIGKMTGEERERFNTEMLRARKENAGQEWFDVFVFTCPPRIIAECAAQAIQKGKA